jgi:hypothetical protein
MDFRYLTESKNEFFEYLCNILVPNLYHGLSDMLEYSINMYNLLEEKRKHDKSINNPGIMNIFKMCLNDISSLNNLEIENEYKKIKDKSKCSEWFDDLVRCTFKSHVLFLTFDPTKENSTYKENDIYNTLSIKDFIHKCYVETSEYFIENCEIFLKKDKKKKVYELIKVCINNSIRKTLPYNDILKEYLRINFVVEQKENELTKLSNIKKMVTEMISKNKYGNKPPVYKIVQDTESSSYKGDDRNDIEEFINIEKVKNNDYKQQSYVKEYRNIEESSITQQPKIIEVQLSSNDSGAKLVTSTIDDRNENKKNEIELILNGGANKLDKISEHNIDLMTVSTINNKEYNNSSSVNEDDVILSKTSDDELISSPPPIKFKKEDRLNEIIKISDKKSDIKKIDIVKNNSSTLSEQEKYFSGLINN